MVGLLEWSQPARRAGSYHGTRRSAPARAVARAKVGKWTEKCRSKEPGLDQDDQYQSGVQHSSRVQNILRKTCAPPGCCAQISGMTRKLVTLLIDDLDGSEAVETVRFGIDGRTFKIDLNGENAARLREVLSEWAACARTVGSSRGGARARVPAQRSASRSEDVSAIREWARTAGYEVSARGRISAKIVTAYRAAMS